MKAEDRKGFEQRDEERVLVRKRDSVVASCCFLLHLIYSALVFLLFSDSAL